MAAIAALTAARASRRAWRASSSMFAMAAAMTCWTSGSILSSTALGVGRDVNEDAAAVVGVGDAFDVAVAFEGVEDAGHRSGGDVHSGADLARRNGAAGTFDDGERVERSVGEAVMPGDCGDKLLGLAADDLELADRARGEPRRAGVFVLERVRFRWTRRDGALAGDATLATCGGGAHLRPPPRFRCEAAPSRRRYSRAARGGPPASRHGAPGAVVLHAVPDDQRRCCSMSLHSPLYLASRMIGAWRFDLK